MTNLLNRAKKFKPVGANGEIYGHLFMVPLGGKTQFKISIQIDWIVWRSINGAD